MSADLFRALAVLAEPPRAETEQVAQVLGLGEIPRPVDYTDLFLMQLYPYASVYVGAEGMLGGEAQDRVAGFWRAIALVPPTEPDHLASLLGLYASLSEREAAAIDDATQARLRHARSALLWEHLLSWVPPFLDKLAEIARPPYASWGRLLGAALHDEAQHLERAADLPLHLREAPGLPNPDAEPLDELLNAFLTPVRSGMIITHTDLVRAAAQTSLGLRRGERRFVLQSLFDQDATASIRWLEGEAGSWARRHQLRSGDAGIVDGFWRDRATTTRRMLQVMRRAIETAIDAGRA